MIYSNFKNLVLSGSTVLLLLVFAWDSNSQSIVRQSINCYGSSHTLIGEISLSQTVGQPYNTTLHNDGTTSPGFQQSGSFKIERVGPIPFEELNIKVYPNPAKHGVIIQCTDVLEGGLVQVSNVQGEIILEEQLNGSMVHKISCGSWSPGIYSIKVQDNSNNQVVRKLIISK